MNDTGGRDNILGDTFDDLKKRFQRDGIDPRRAYQVFNWVHRKFVSDFASMSDLPKDLRAKLAGRYSLDALELADKAADPAAGTEKYLFRCGDGAVLETVLIASDEDHPDRDSPRLTLCVSSQAGCPLGCVFCATGKLGLTRSLTAGEIVSQVLSVERLLRENNGHSARGTPENRRLSNIVFMGMGEPFLNIGEVLQSIHVLTFSGGYHMGARHFTVSTAGIPDGIRRLAAEDSQVRLAVSLHTAMSAKREELMPVARKHPLDELIRSLRDYQSATGRRITFEIIVIPGLNDTEDDVRALEKNLRGLDCHLNLIAYNPVDGLSYRVPSAAEMRSFRDRLVQRGLNAVIRKSKGSSIRAGCGQLGMSWKKLEKGPLSPGRTGRKTGSSAGSGSVRGSGSGRRHRPRSRK